VKKQGVFIISLDFELYWGIHGNRTLESYKDNLLGVYSAVPALLELFNEYKISATWATVGFLFFKTRDELKKCFPDKKPAYINDKLSPYEHINNIGRNAQEDPFHYAPSLLKMIASFPGQEIGTHTFSHYRCLERGHDVDAFRDDLDSAIRVARQYNTTLESLVFPVNQFNSEYVSVCREMGITAYRGNESSWIYSARNTEDESLLRRGFRLLDAYVNISGHNSYSLESITKEFPFNIPSSRFLRPYSKKLTILEPLRLRRILSDLTYAARNGHVYHLWWHPHNFGVYLEENITFLRKILEHYSKLKGSYGMRSLNMGQLSEMLTGSTGGEA
jgi:peptidoglycan/xylan/chitin deacetylase (PgdA/CDA1 family)